MLSTGRLGTCQDDNIATFVLVSGFRQVMFVNGWSLVASNLLCVTIVTRLHAVHFPNRTYDLNTLTYLSAIENGVKHVHSMWWWVQRYLSGPLPSVPVSKETETTSCCRTFILVSSREIKELHRTS